ncbi:MAG: ATP-binding cassette domain-containing protein, partial [Burkholderiales bacterium]|nr:ATP-binding cassette domain-containing protein [Burkholderiales bacterium]
SGGQRQRVALARAFYFGRRVLVLDEATSALDGATENAIVDELQQLGDDVSVIFITHRLITLRNCDRVYRIEKGRVASSGSYTEVIAAGS